MGWLLPIPLPLLLCATTQLDTGDLSVMRSFQRASRLSVWLCMRLDLSVCVQHVEIHNPVSMQALVVDLNEAMHEVRKAQDLMLDEDEHNCCVCFDVKRSVLIQPCGHLCLCQDCSHTVTVTNECPLCRGPIASLVTVYQ